MGSLLHKAEVLRKVYHLCHYDLCATDYNKQWVVSLYAVVSYQMCLAPPVNWNVTEAGVDVREVCHQKSVASKIQNTNTGTCKHVSTN